MIIPKDNVVFGGNSPLPFRNYRARCIKASFGKSNAGKPMTTLGCEIIEPESIEDAAGNPLRIAGRAFTLYLVHTTELVGRQTQSSHASVLEFLAKLQIPVEDFDTDKVEEYFLGMEFDILLQTKENIKRYAPLPGQKEGAPILDGEGKEISSGHFIDAQMGNVPPNCRPERSNMPSR